MQKVVERNVSAQRVANIVGCVLDATEEEYAAGMLWYQSFGAAIAAYGTARGVDRERSLAVFAALSPRMHISRNWALFKHAIDHGSMDGATGVLGHVRRKVDGLLNATLGIEEATRGQKVTSFYKNLSGDLRAVTIDTHAVCAAMGAQEPAKGLTCGQYLDYEACYQVAAAQLGVEPAQAQAIAWIVWRRQQGRTDGGGIRLLP